MEDTIQGTMDSAENYKDKILPSWSGSFWVPQEADTETQLGIKEVDVCVRVEECGVIPMKGIEGGSRTGLESFPL